MSHSNLLCLHLDSFTSFCLTPPQTTFSTISESASLTGIRHYLSATPLEGQSGYLANSIPVTGYEPKTCIHVSSEHTPIKYTYRKNGFNIEDHVTTTVAASENSDGFHNLERKFFYLEYSLDMRYRGKFGKADIEELENMDASEIYPRRINAKEDEFRPRQERLVRCEDLSGDCQGGPLTQIWTCCKKIEKIIGGLWTRKEVYQKHGQDSGSSHVERKTFQRIHVVRRETNNNSSNYQA